VNPDPFPHLVLDGEWSDDLIGGAHAEMLGLFRTAPGAWQLYSNGHEGKLAMTFGHAERCGAVACADMGRLLASPEWIARLEDMTGLTGLSFDDLGGGLHLIPLGGHLDVHIDFNRHRDGRYRRINCLVYLCETGSGGALELWRDETSGPVVTIEPKANRTAIFLTGETSWHGHPHQLQGEALRCSLAAYYYTTTPPDGVAVPHSTVFLGA
jgi:hypothetical protein